MSNLLLQKIVLLWVTEVGKIILKKKRPLLLARSVCTCNHDYKTLAHERHDRHTYKALPSNLYYKVNKISKLKCYSSRLAVVFAQSIEARC